MRASPILGQLLGGCALDAVVDPHLVAEPAAEQHVDRELCRLPCDVPEGVVDPRQRGPPHRSLGKTHGVAGPSHEPLDARRVAAYEPGLDGIDQAEDTLVWADGVGLAQLQ